MTSKTTETTKDGWIKVMVVMLGLQPESLVGGIATQRDASLAPGCFISRFQRVFWTKEHFKI